VFFSKFSIISLSLKYLVISLMCVLNVLLPLDCLMTSALSMSYISFAESSGSTICWTLLEITPSMMPAPTSFALVHFSSTALYFLISSVVGVAVVIDVVVVAVVVVGVMTVVMVAGG